MRVSSLALLAIAAASPMLSGCQSIFGPSRGFSPALSIPERADPATYAASQMEQGRQALESQQFGLAIVAFRNARLAREHTAAACNGLAIAYAQIGRRDLAERYFKQAIAEAPGDRKYQANLARFHASLPDSPVQLAAKAWESSRSEVQAPASQFLPGTRERSAIRIEQPAQKIVRLSVNEVRIGTQPAFRRRALEGQAAPPKSVRRVNPAYPVRIEFGEIDSPIHAKQPAREYPIRIEFGKSAQPVHVKQAARQYPIRVSLAPSNR